MLREDLVVLLLMAFRLVAILLHLLPRLPCRRPHGFVLHSTSATIFFPMRFSHDSSKGLLLRPFIKAITGPGRARVEVAAVE
jgi:hypothetical protein